MPSPVSGAGGLHTRSGRTTIADKQGFHSSATMFAPPPVGKLYRVLYTQTHVMSPCRLPRMQSGVGWTYPCRQQR
jgi:hypothetical protein